MKDEPWIHVAEAILKESCLSVRVMAHYFDTYPQFYEQLEAMFRELQEPPMPSWYKWVLIHGR